jgi:hypothetical protein
MGNLMLVMLEILNKLNNNILMLNNHHIIIIKN